MVVYHGTVRNFNVFRPLSHFGTAEQANNRLKSFREEDLRILPVFLKIKKPVRAKDDGTTLFNEGTLNYAKSLGGDGVVYENEVEGPGDSYMIFNPDQVKSAIGNIGAFTPSGNILHSAVRVDANDIESYLHKGGAPRNQQVREDSERISRTLSLNTAGEVGQTAIYAQAELFALEQRGESQGQRLAERGKRIALQAAKTSPTASSDLIAGLQGDWAALAREIDAKGRASSIFSDLVENTIPNWDVVGTVIKTSADAAALLQPLRSPYFESVKVLVLDDESKVVASQIVSIGSIRETVFDTKRIFSALVKIRETTGKDYKSVIVSHNHPSGDPTPSTNDHFAQNKISDLAKLVGFEVVDHIITNGRKYYSFAREKLFLIDDNSTLAPWEALPRHHLLPLTY